MAEQIILWWRDIPAQVNGRAGRKRVAVKLSERFEKAIDRAAMRARLVGTDDYLQEWRRTTSTLEGAGEGESDLEQAVRAQATALEEEYDTERLEKLIEQEGFAEGASKSAKA